MRWTEIAAYAQERGLPLPTYRQMDLWTRNDKLTAEMREDSRGRYRWWPDSEVAVALLVARFLAAGFRVDLAFKLARAELRDLTRTVVTDDVTVSVKVVS